MPRGGRRPGAGRKPKSVREHAVTGDAGRRGKVLQHPGVAPIETAPVVVDEFDAPNDLMADERVVWVELAPHAFQARTLNKATALAFRMLCRDIVLERELGQTNKKGTADHRGVRQRVAAELLAFNLRPCGKAMEAAAPEQVAPANPLSRFLKR
jgi:hypothetical protein